MNAFHYVMSHLKVAQVARDERGVTALEYAMIAALIGLVIIGGVTSFGSALNTYFTALGTKVGTFNTK